MKCMFLCGTRGKYCNSHCALDSHDRDLAKPKKFGLYFFFFFLTLFNYIQKFQDNSLTRRAKKSVSHFLCSTARHREGSSPGPTTWVSHVPSNTRT